MDLIFKIRGWRQIVDLGSRNGHLAPKNQREMWGGWDAKDLWIRRSEKAHSNSNGTPYLPRGVASTETSRLSLGSPPLSLGGCRPQTRCFGLGGFAFPTPLPALGAAASQILRFSTGGSARQVLSPNCGSTSETVTYF